MRVPLSSLDTCGVLGGLGGGRDGTMVNDRRSTAGAQDLAGDDIEDCAGTEVCGGRDDVLPPPEGVSGVSGRRREVGREVEVVDRHVVHVSRQIEQRVSYVAPDRAICLSRRQNSRLFAAHDALFMPLLGLVYVVTVGAAPLEWLGGQVGGVDN